ncbi:MAG: amidohydrolase [Acidimicrobiales bacterium]|nr:amidohydrolase [Acidimicrobiales bacterium]
MAEGVSGPARYCVVSADGHVGPSVKGQLRQYCEAKYLDDFDRFVDEMEGHLLYTDAAYLEEPIKSMRYEHSLVAGLQDEAARRADMDADGIAADVLFHGGLNGQSVPFSTTGLITWSNPAYNALEAVGVHIYNRWLADFVSNAPKRHVGVAHIPISDPDACVREVEWAASNGLKAVNLPAPRNDFPMYNSGVWEPLWAACEANGVVLTTHAGGGNLYPFEGVEAVALFLIESSWLSRRSVWVLILSGVFERHPKLKFLATEQYGDWAPNTLADMDSAYYATHTASLRAVLPKPPSEYFMSNCFIGASFMSPSEAREGIGNGLERNLLWGADYPHWEGTWPRTLPAMRHTFATLPVAPVRRYLGENAIDVFGLDRAELTKLASQIGPKVDDVAVEFEPPPEMVRGFAFRQHGKFS